MEGIKDQFPSDRRGRITSLLREVFTNPPAEYREPGPITRKTVRRIALNGLIFVGLAWASDAAVLHRGSSKPTNPIPEQPSAPSESMPSVGVEQMPSGDAPFLTAE